MRIKTILGLCAGLCILCFCSPGGMDKDTTASSTEYSDLVKLFQEFREYQKPAVMEGVPDYTDQAMAEQYNRLDEFRQKLESIDPSGWTVPERVDYEILRAEINGLDFDHRVFFPWKRDPGFYAVITTYEPDVPAREGPEIFNVLYLP